MFDLFLRTVMESFKFKGLLVLLVGLILSSCGGGGSVAIPIIDQTAPVVTAPAAIIVASLDVTGTAATDSGIVRFLAAARALDNIDVTSTVTNNAPMKFPMGVTTVIFSSTDTAGNIGTASAIVTVSDQTAPVITLLGANSTIVAQGSTYLDAGSSVIDNVDTGLTAVFTGRVNTAVLGRYTLTYHVSDAAGNAAVAVTRTVNVAFFPTLSIANARVAEGSTLGTKNLNFTVALSAASTNVVKVSYATSDGTALSTSDYTASNATLSILAGNTTGTITVLINADKTYEANETLTLTLSNPTVATIATASAIGTIMNDDVGGMNDTGIITWTGIRRGLTVSQLLFPNQDADRGRDAVASLVKKGGGKAGFDFTKLDAVGQPLANQTGAYRAAPWDCVQDNVTGLMWEVKTTVAGLRNKYNGYAWYNSTGVNDGGKTGAPAANPACSTGGGCDTEKYVAAVNVAGLCGFNDWRLPRKEALRSIIDYSSARMTIDTSYFPNTVRYRGRYWSASPYAGNAAQAWLFDFTKGAIGYVMHKGNNFYVRLVRGGQ